MGLSIAKISVDLMLRLVNKLSKKCRKVDQNCKHVKWLRERYLCKFQTKLSQDVALGMMDKEQSMVNYDAVHLQLSCWLFNFFRCNHKMVEKLNSINEYSIWYEIWDELSKILPTYLTQKFFEEEWSKIMTI